MTPTLALLIILAVAVTVAVVSQKYNLSYTVALVIVGAALSIVKYKFFPEFDVGIHLSHELLFDVLLPILIFEAAFHLKFKPFFANLKWILNLAGTGLLIGIALCTALIFYGCAVFGIHISIGTALLISTIVSATDPVGVISLLRATQAPHKLAVLMEGESLLNDGLAVVLGTIVFILLGFDHHASLSVPWLVKFVLLEIGGSILLGGGIGFVISELMNESKDNLVLISFISIAAFGSFLIAEEIHSSGVLSCLTCGMVVGNMGAERNLSASSKLAVLAFLDYAAFAANSIIFLLIGLDLEIQQLPNDLGAILITWVAMLIARFFFVWQIDIWLPGMPKGYVPVIAWGGVRGGIAMVLALSIPQEFGFRDLAVHCIFGASLLTILIQSTTMKSVLGKYGLVKEKKQLQVIDVIKGKLSSLQSARYHLEKQFKLGAISDEVYNQFSQELAYEGQKIEKWKDKTESLRKQAEEEEARLIKKQLLEVRKENILSAASHGSLEQEIAEKLIAEIDEEIHHLNDH
ncbi:cation:proton antiporter [Pseudobacteriovorax antillogorgiicola]|uniref:Sodium/proton antiporter, CPA1 family n=1 Tax=Pseudobacteriovorax antillogorgiicola TaxID=1513793 RepID=A0A1Y6B8K8_9BACT|nr:cation:proton antiporter [Pseudobacteriovorax antillogorgiicola]TCS58831.1 sodium/proton antiporter (CPA1 family) [Pseudobacteriovorax antillogorgiicola]SME94180.1 sodium/proton antiporter, CPA1 family [Pseudobacteriovorax antillogorgiicola]